MKPHPNVPGGDVLTGSLSSLTPALLHSPCPPPVVRCAPWYGPRVASPIPTLDFALAETDAFAEELDRAFGEMGFVALENHGLEPTLRRRAFEVVERFFALPLEAKRAYFVEGGAGARGYTPFGIEVAKDQTTPDLKEFWHVGRELDNAPGAPRYPENLWPEELPEFRPILTELYQRLEAIGDRVLAAVARGLHLPSSYFTDKTNFGNSILRALHYPPIGDERGGAVRAAAHEDINLITLLIGSEEPGLEVLSKSGEWVEAPRGNDLIVCNVGDMLQRLTNRALASTTHRVVNPPSPWCGVSRYSLPFFLHPNSDFLIETLPSCIASDRPNRYPVPITADDYLKERLREIGLL